MQPDLYTPFIVASYAVAAVILGAVALHTIFQYRRAKSKKKSRA